MIYIYEKEPDIEYKFKEQTRTTPYWSPSSQPPSSGNHTIYMRDSEAEIHEIIPDENDPYPMAVIPSFTVVGVQSASNPDLSITWSSSPFSPAGFDLALHLIKEHYVYFSNYDRTTQIIKITVTYSGQNQVYWYRLDPRSGFSQHIAFYWNGNYGPWEDTGEVVWASVAPESTHAVQWVYDDEKTHEGNWKPVKHLLPLAVNNKKDASLNTAVVSRYMRKKEVLHPKTWIRIEDGGEVTSWIVENCQCVRIGPNLYKQTISLVEAIELFKGDYLGNMSVTQPLNPDVHHPKKSLLDTVEKVLKGSPSPRYKPKSSFNPPIDKTGFDDMIFEGDWLDVFETESPEFFFTEYTRYDAMLEIGLYVDMEPKIEFTDDGKMGLYFEEMELSNPRTYNLGNVLVEENQHPLANYASEVVSSVSNLSVSTEVVYPANDVGVYVNAPEGEYEITNDNAIITLPSNIQKITKFEVKPNLITKTGTDGKPITSGGSWRDYTNRCLEYGQWMSTVPESWDKGRGDAYFHAGGNQILNLDSFFHLNVYDSYFSHTLRRSLFRITYIPVIDTKLIESNDSEVQHTAIYNQSGDIVDNKSYAEFMKNFVKRMKHGDFVVSKYYKNYDSIPKAGHLAVVDGDEYIITNMSYMKYISHYDVTLQLSKEHSRRAEFVRVKDEIRTWEIPTNKSMDRIVTIKESVKFSLGTPIEYEERNSIMNGEIDLIYPTLTRNNDAKKLMALLEFDLADGTTRSVLQVPIVGQLGSNKTYTFKAPHHTTIGYNKSLNWQEAVNNQIAVLYTDNFGNFEQLHVAITHNYNPEVDEETFARNYPVPTGLEGLFIIQSAQIKMNDIEISKDTRDIFGLTYQVSPAGENETIITSHINTFSDEGLRLFFLNKKINNPVHFEVSPISNTLIKSSLLIRNHNISHGNKSITYSFSGPSVPENFEGVAIGDFTDGRYRLIVISNGNGLKEKLKTGEITLYWS